MRSTFNILFYVNKSKEKNGVVYLQEDKLVFGKMNYWSMCKKLKKVMEACGIEKSISFHCGRHSFATLALSKGMPI